MEGIARVPDLEKDVILYVFYSHLVDFQKYVKGILFLMEGAASDCFFPSAKLKEKISSLSSFSFFPQLPPPPSPYFTMLNSSHLCLYSSSHAHDLICGEISCKYSSGDTVYANVEHKGIESL